MTQNQIARQNAIELERHNRAGEYETNRHQLKMEALEAWKHSLTQRQLDISERSLSENIRSNQANEAIRSQQNAINAAAASETLRHNQALEQIQSQQTESQTSLNRALSAQAAATEASNYALANLNREKISTEKSVQVLNSANAGLSTTKAVNYPYEAQYVISQTALNKAKVINTNAQTQNTQVRTTHEGVNMLWDSISNAANLIFGGKRK